MHICEAVCIPVVPNPSVHGCTCRNVSHGVQKYLCVFVSKFLCMFTGVAVISVVSQSLSAWVCMYLYGYVSVFSYFWCVPIPLLMCGYACVCVWKCTCFQCLFLLLYMCTFSTFISTYMQVQSCFPWCIPIPVSMFLLACGGICVFWLAPKHFGVSVHAWKCPCSLMQPNSIVHVHMYASLPVSNYLPLPLLMCPCSLMQPNSIVHVHMYASLPVSNYLPLPLLMCRLHLCVFVSKFLCMFTGVAVISVVSQSLSAWFCMYLYGYVSVFLISGVSQSLC